MPLLSRKLRQRNKQVNKKEQGEVQEKQALSNRITGRPQNEILKQRTGAGNQEEQAVCPQDKVNQTCKENEEQEQTTNRITPSLAKKQ